MSLRGVVRRALGSLIHRLWAAVRAAGAVSPTSPAGYRFRRLGEGACLSFPVGAIFGEAWIEIGDHTLIGERVSVSAGMGLGMDLGRTRSYGSAEAAPSAGAATSWATSR